MYRYEIVTNKTRVKTNSMEQAIIVLRFIIEKNYDSVFIDRKEDLYLKMETMEDIAKLEKK